MKQTKLNIARILLIIGFVIGLISWWQTMSHVGDKTYTLIPEFSKGKYHAWYHAFREAIGNLTAMVVLLTIFFGKKSWRTPNIWWISLLLLFGYYVPFWIGTPFVPELAAPNIKIEIIHLLMATLPIIGLFIARKYFFNILVQKVSQSK